MRIILSEHDNPNIKKAIKICRRDDNLSFLRVNSLKSGLNALRYGEGDAFVAGIDITTRDMVLACKENLPRKEKYFSSCFVMRNKSKTYILADAGVCKNPDADVLKAIVLETYDTAKKVLDEEPRIAMLSFSSFGSGGKDATITKIQEVIDSIHTDHPEIMIDGEMQLDAAIDSGVALRKAPNSPVAGRANVLVCPDLNSANILYKSLERFGGFTAAGPILQGFNYAISDLSRGSTVEDIVLTFRILEKIYEHDNVMATAVTTPAEATPIISTPRQTFAQRLLDAWDMIGNFGRRKQ